LKFVRRQAASGGVQARGSFFAQPDKWASATNEITSPAFMPRTWQRKCPLSTPSSSPTAQVGAGDRTGRFLERQIGH
ncbi:hypothetical protein ACNJFI_21140, partial [Mycobacterium tuberculosis]